MWRRRHNDAKAAQFAPLIRTCHSCGSIVWMGMDEETPENGWWKKTRNISPNDNRSRINNESEPREEFLRSFAVGGC